MANWGLEFLSYEIELQSQVTQNDVTLRVKSKIFKDTSKDFIEIILLSC